MRNNPALHSSRQKETPPVCVVTGAAGFLGQGLVRRLLAEGNIVRAVVLRGDPLVAELRASSPEGEGLEIVEGDVADFDSITEAFRGAKRVFHAAAVVHAWASWDAYRRVNVRGTENVARAALAHGVERFVAVSTSDVFGIPRRGERMDESSPFRTWGEPYPDSKIEAERWLWQFRAETGLPLSVIYPCWIYGPGDRAFFPGFADAIAAGVMVDWFRGVRLAWVYIDNLVDACLLASTHPAAVGNGYLVHDGMNGPTLEEVCVRIADVIGARRPRLQVPYWLMNGAALSMQLVWRLLRLKEPPLLRTVDIKAFGFQWNLSNEKLQRELGWRPRVPVEEGMQRALEYLATHWEH